MVAPEDKDTFAEVLDELDPIPDDDRVPGSEEDLSAQEFAGLLTPEEDFD